MLALVKSSYLSICMRFIQMGVRQSLTALPLVWFASVLSVEDFGRFAYGFGVLSIYLMIADFGLSVVVFRKCAVVDSVTASKLLCSFSVFGFIVAFLLVFTLSIILRFDFFECLGFAFVAAMHLVYMSLDSYFRGFKRFSLLAMFTFFAAIPYFSCLALLGASSYLLAYVLFYLFFVIFSFFVVRFKGRLDLIAFFDAVLEAKHVFLSTLGYIFIYRFDLVLLGAFASYGDVGVYELSDKFQNLVVFAFVIIGQVFVVDFLVRGERAMQNFIRENFIRIALGGIVVSLAFCLVFFLYVRNFLFLEDFALVSLLSVLLCLRMLNTLFVQFYMFSYSFDFEAVKINFYSAVVNVVFSFYLVGFYGLKGVVLGTVLANFCSLILILKFFRRRCFI